MKLGHITGWELEQVVFPSGTGSEYDFLTITHFKNWKAIDEVRSYWTDEMWTTLTNGLTPEQLELADNAQEYRETVKREIWTATDMVFAPGGKRPMYAVENFMLIPPGGMGVWKDMETEFVMPVHKKSIEMGTRAGWLMGFMVMPRGKDYNYQASTIDFYDSWEQMGLDEGKAWQAVHPDVNWGEAIQLFNAASTIVQTEVRRLIDYVD